MGRGNFVGTYYGMQSNGRSIVNYGQFHMQVRITIVYDDSAVFAAVNVYSVWICLLQSKIARMVRDL